MLNRCFFPCVPHVSDPGLALGAELVLCGQQEEHVRVPGAYNQISFLPQVRLSLHYSVLAFFFFFFFTGFQPFSARIRIFIQCMVFTPQTSHTHTVFYEILHHCTFRGCEFRGDFSSWLSDGGKNPPSDLLKAIACSTENQTCWKLNCCQTRQCEWTTFRGTLRATCWTFCVTLQITSN